MDLQLAYMDDGTDGFPLIVAKKEDMAEIIDLSNQAGWPVKTYFA